MQFNFASKNVARHSEITAAPTFGGGRSDVMMRRAGHFQCCSKYRVLGISRSYLIKMQTASKRSVRCRRAREKSDIFISASPRSMVDAAAFTGAVMACCAVIVLDFDFTGR